MPDAFSTPGVMPPYMDPSEYPAYMDLMRKQMAAQAIMGAFQQSNQTPQDWNSMRVVPRRSPLQNVASLATALMAPQAMRGAQDAEMRYFAGMSGAPNTSAPAPSGAPTAPSSAPPAPVMGAYSPQPTQGTGAPPAASSAAVGNPMIPTGMDPRQAQMLLNLTGPQGYGQILARQYQPAQIVAQLRAAGIDPNSPQGQMYARMALNKATQNIVNMRPGGALYDANSGGVIGFNPRVPEGASPSFQGGAPTGVSMLPGATEAIAAGQGAETGGRVANTPTDIPTQGGGSQFGYPGDIIGLPPALRSPSTAAPMPPGNAGGNSAPVAPLRGAWATMPKLNISQSVGSPNEFVKGQLQAAATKDADLATQYGHESDLAGQQLEWNREAREALPKAEVGPMSDWLTKSRAWLTEAGVPESLIPSSGSVVPTMQLNKALKNAALQGARQIYGPRMSQMEVKLQTEEMSPSSSMMRDAIASLMRQNDIRNMYAQARAEDYSQYMSRGGNPLRFESWYATNFPLTKFADAAAMSPKELQALAKQRGLQ